ncbi:MAG: TerB family tellurite resistance protein [Deltaproteobacteria bacterium]|nr:TerB family tellurite resistance protein [Deltaproteobacteria bacterium]
MANAQESDNQIRARIASPMILVLGISGLLLSACAAPTGTENPADADIDFGIGSKADEGGCDRASDLCWTSADADTMRLLMRLENDVLLQEGHMPTALGTIVGLARQVEHKLDDQELEQLTRLDATVAALPRDMASEDAVGVLADMQASVLSRVKATHYAAFMVPIGRRAERDLAGGADDPTDTGADDGADSDNPFYTVGMQESLRLLRDNGALGKSYAWMLEASGVLERDYTVVNANNFGTYDADHDVIIPLGMSRDEQVDRIVNHYKWAAAQVGVVAGAEALIPIAGVPISIAHETYALFRLHAQMAFEIAAVHGWDIREGRNLFTVSLMVMTVGAITEVADVFAANAILPIVARTLASRLGVTLPLHQLERDLAQRSVTMLLRIFSRKSQQKLAGAALRQGVRGISSQLLGYATLGLAVFASGALDYAATVAVGRHVETIAKRWFGDMMMDGTSYLAGPSPRDCMFKAFDAMIWADGTLAEREKNLFMAMMNKPYRTDESTWLHLAPTERIRHSRNLAAARDQTDTMRDALTCAENEFQRTMPRHRMALLAHLYAMANVDTEEHPEERAFYDRLTAQIDGHGWFDGSELDIDQLQYVERSVYVSIYPGVIEVGSEHSEAVAAILPEEVMPFLATPGVEVSRDFRCGYEGVCW